MVKGIKQSGRNQQGVTLIELMIAVVIVGIIGAVAYPSYVEFVNKSRRADAMAALQSFAGAMERHFTVNSSYCGAGTDATASCGASSGGDPTIFPTEAPLDGAEKYYELDISVASDTSFTLTATPIGAQTGDTCGTLSIQHTGARLPAGGDCWP
ncbi:type IV pilin protein [Motiliproteus coralliicola]|uniref:Type IV pilin protein n=1 Tax=Motiliproteus coralliicola TaxID=2283196 RepID=A0A369W926_9GAMM|nr:type IV pilin protein [Motiliproteus coralliicola]RDE18498.1 type IV pilin protein [Motiliproteus coralliicola]